MELENTNIVAKDSDGNIKKVELADLLSPYVKSEEIDELLLDKWPTTIKNASLSLFRSSAEGKPLDFPFSVESIKLTTVGYGSNDIIYEQEYDVDSRTLTKSSDAYEFSVQETGAPFGVSSNRQCFLVLSIAGHERIIASSSVVEEECRLSGAHGGNPIVLDWNGVVLGEGGIFKFSLNDETQPVGIYGTLHLQRRVNQTGNIHNYDFELSFVVCGQKAWKNLNEAAKLHFQTVDTNNIANENIIDLSAFAYPRISEIGDGENSFAFSKVCSSKIAFRGGNGIIVEASEVDSLNLSEDRKTISFELKLNDIAGSGLTVNEDGKISVPSFIPVEGTADGVPGLVPKVDSSNFDSILTASGWKPFAELGFGSVLKPFVGAAMHEDGEQGFVPAPLIANAGMFLKGDGTWSNAMTSLAGSVECETSLVGKNHSFGLSFCNSNGEWMMQATQFFIALHPEEIEEGSFELNASFEDVCGLSLCTPWSAKIPASVSSNTTEWTADKTIWINGKTSTFSCVFSNGFSVDVWIEAGSANESLLKHKTVVHYRGNGCKTSINRPFILSIDDTIQEYSLDLAENESGDIAVSGSIIKAWPTSAKERMLYEPAKDDSPSEVPWGGSIWVNQEQTAMLTGGQLVYIGDPINPVEALIEYDEHPAGSQILVYGLEEKPEMWDIVLREAISYNGVQHPAGTVIGHVWRDGTDIASASLLFANWNDRPVLHESDHEIAIPDNGEEWSDDWIALNSVPAYFPSLGIELSKTADGVHVHAPAVNLDTWPRMAESVDLVLDAGFTGTEIQFSCLKEWLNSRFEGFDQSLTEVETKLQNGGAIFTGATSSSNGISGLVPSAASAEKDCTLHGDGTWKSDIVVTRAMPHESDTGTVFFYIQD